MLKNPSKNCRDVDFLLQRYISANIFIKIQYLSSFYTNLLTETQILDET